MLRYCIKCGQAVTKKDDNLFVCNEGHENWVNPVVGSTVYVLKGDQVLFGVRSINPNQGKLCIPGGFINLDETAEQAAIREVKEELGIDIAISHYLGSYPSKYLEDRPVLNIVFVAKHTGGEITPGDDMNDGDPVWRNIDNLPKIDEISWDWYAQPQKDLLSWWNSVSKQQPGLNLVYDAQPKNGL